MDAKAFFQKLIQLPGEFDERQSALLAAEESQIDNSNEADLEVLAIQKLLKSIELVRNLDKPMQALQTLYYIAEYAVFTQKPRVGIPWCYVVMNYPGTSSDYRERAEKLLIEIKLKLPRDMYDAAVQETSLNIQHALDDAQTWLESQQRHASQPSTKVVFNSRYINKKSQTSGKS